MNIMRNSVQDISALAAFKNLVCLQVSYNKIKNLNIFTEEENFPRLRRLEAAGNKIAELPALQCPKLEYLDVSENKVDKFENWAGHPNLKTLLLAENKLKTMTLFQNLPKLKTLSLRSNPIPALTGFDGLVSLESLDVEGTKIDKVEEEMPKLPALTSLNLAGTRVSQLDNIKHLLGLFTMETLRDLNISDTPLENNASSFNFLLAEILILFPKLATYCETEVTDKHRYEALYTAQYRWEKKEEERKRKEEEQRLKEEAEAAEND